MLRFHFMNFKHGIFTRLSTEKWGSGILRDGPLNKQQSEGFWIKGSSLWETSN